MRIGYARVSTEEQNLDLQIDALRGSGCESIYSDQGISGAKINRPGLAEALRVLKAGDTLVVWKLDRLGRSIRDLISVMSDLNRSGIRFVSLTELIDTESSTGRFTFHMIAALAEFERALISERTRAGLEAARRRGSRLGRPKALQNNEIWHARELLAAHSESVVARSLQVHPRTLSRSLKIGEAQERGSEAPEEQKLDRHVNQMKCMQSDRLELYNGLQINNTICMECTGMLIPLGSMLFLSRRIGAKNHAVRDGAAKKPLSGVTVRMAANCVASKLGRP
ncbi:MULTISPECIES: recombinase family protein [Burkholderia cepacia complex]|uniref:recombinase family protein n=1 Tax=Burkholderia cepacia complex TaxID=87882 RepID=UPI0009B5500B|nr:recombinase family protein [Burkholderia vietnamiensis]